MEVCHGSDLLRFAHMLCNTCVNIKTNFPFRLPNVIPVAARSKAWVCGRALAGIVGLNLTGGMHVSLLYSVCVVRWRSLRGADPSSRGVLPTVVCV
jgi:hypothetical protein